MDIRAFNPHVRFCSAVWLHSEYEKRARAYDYRLFYVLFGGFTACFEERTVTVREGGVLLFPPGRAYRLIPDEYKKSNHIIVNFDFVSDKTDAPPLTVFEPEPYLPERICPTECIEPFSDIFHLENAFFCREILEKMCEEIKADRLHAAGMLSGLMKQLLSLISRETSTASHSPESAAERLCAQVTEYLKTAALGDIDNGVIAKEFGYHPYYLNAVFKKTTGATLHTHIAKRRIEIARELLLSSEKSIAEIGMLCGFSGASYFSECFKAHVGVTPREYRQRAK